MIHGVINGKAVLWGLVSTFLARLFGFVACVQGLLYCCTAWPGDWCRSLHSAAPPPQTGFCFHAETAHITGVLWRPPSVHPAETAATDCRTSHRPHSNIGNQSGAAVAAGPDRSAEWSEAESCNTCNTPAWPVWQHGTRAATLQHCNAPLY